MFMLFHQDGDDVNEKMDTLLNDMNSWELDGTVDREYRCAVKGFAGHLSKECVKKVNLIVPS